MMNAISFIEDELESISLKAIGVYEQNMPSFLSEEEKLALGCFPYSPAVESLRVQNGSCCKTVVTRLGDQNKASRLSREEAGAHLWKKLEAGIETRLLLDIRNLGEEGLDLLVGLLLAAWRFDKYRTHLKPQDTRNLKEIFVLCEDAELMQEQFKVPFAAVKGTLYARELSSEPPNQLPPSAYAERLKQLEATGVQVEILDQSALEAAGMTALLAVAQGSEQPPRVAILKWNGTHSKCSAPIAFVGKGVCFDSGGLCLKTKEHQLDMKWDKAGAGVVAGLIQALALAKAPVSVVGILGLVENMPDGKATKPGDVLRTASGKTIEVVDTDAEGRLVLADCLWYAQQRFKPSHLIDLGTLTPESFAALGTQYAALYANDQVLGQELLNSGRSTGELLWELPMGPYFAKQIESHVADIKNLGIESFGENGAAAEFLRCFVQDGMPWAHLDIAGVAWTKEDLPLAVKGVTGFGVRLLFDWTVKLTERKKLK